MRLRTPTKRVLTLATVAALTATTVLSHMWLMPHASCPENKQHEWTGLKLYCTHFPDATGQLVGWPRKNYLLGGNGEYKGMDHAYCYCVAAHTGQEYAGKEAYLYEGAGPGGGALTIQDYRKFEGNKDVRYPSAIEEDMKKFAFCLAAAAANAPGQRSDRDVKDGIDGTCMYALAAAFFSAIDNRHGFAIKTMDKEEARAAYYAAMQIEFSLEPQVWNGQRVEAIHPAIRDQILANREAFFDQVWDAAMILYDSIQMNGNQPVINSLVCEADPSNPRNYIVTVDCHKQESLWKNYYSKLKAISPEGCQKISSSYDAASGTGTIVFQLPPGEQEPPSFQFEDSSFLTDLSKPVLYQLNFCGDGENQCGNYQVIFSAMHEVPIFHGPTTSDIPVIPDREPSEGSIELEVHRYRHSETWRSTYNTDLLKFDSETGKPLADSQWDILEYDTLGSWEEEGTQLGETWLDHPVSEASSIGTRYNWANDEGSQFIRWQGEDACDRDFNITGPDGYLYETDTIGNRTGTKAHEDVYHYTYTKGYCTGHPDPVIYYYECNHDAEDDCDCEERNAELRRMAEEAYKEQVEYCERLAEEGGFFHTDARGISEMAKSQLEADRDEFYKDYISLTYEYSARELAARKGYILHGTHTDDIPIERVVIHSSEYLDEIAGGRSRRASVVRKTEEEIGRQEEVISPEAEDADDEEEVHEEESAVSKEETVLKPVIHKNSETVAAESAASKETKDSDVQTRESDRNDEDLEQQSEDSDRITGETSADTVFPDTLQDKAVRADQEGTVPEDMKKLSVASSSNAKEEPKETLAPEEDPEQNMELDFDLIDPESVASASDAGRPERKSIVNILWEKTSVLSQSLNDGKDSKRKAARTEREREYAREDAEPPKQGSPVRYIGAVNYEPSEIEPRTQGQSDIGCWTFTVFDHRTEGEIHFNKRDLDLQRAGEDASTLFGSYAQENGDGALEGAVYGLFALTDLLHPDSDQTGENEENTGLVYQAGDLVSVAVTDRNGDGSFLVCTEEPGMTYDYESGSIVKRTDKPWDGPSNLHTAGEKADAAVSDNEKFYGWDAECRSEVTLRDSAPEDKTFYWKFSSNQGLNKGEGQEHGTKYPILDNEGNNGNCWIGRPLFVSGKNTASYVIKELSRSEGYELSIYGKEMSLTNRNAPEDGGMTVEGTISASPMQVVQNGSEGDISSTNSLTITAVDTRNGFDVAFQNLTDSLNIPEFFLAERKLVQKEQLITELVPRSYPVMAKAGDPVLIDGKRVEAKRGDAISLPNGTTAVVQNTVTDSGEKFYIPKTQIALALPNAQRYNLASGSTFMEKYNAALAAKRFGTPSVHAPWLLVPKGGSDAESFTYMTESLHSYTGFDQMRIVADLGSAYAVQYSHSQDSESIYDLNNQILWVKKEVSFHDGSGFLYAGYPTGDLNHNGTGFFLNNQKPDQETFRKYEDLSLVSFQDAPGGTYWAYAEGDQALEEDGSPAFYEKLEEESKTVVTDVYEDVLTEISEDRLTYDAVSNTYTIHFDGPGTYEVRIAYQREMTGSVPAAVYARQNADIHSYAAFQTAGTYLEEVRLLYPGDGEVL